MAEGLTAPRVQAGPRILVLVLLLASSLHVAAAAAADDDDGSQKVRRRACEESGYCSVGVSRPFVGDIKDSGQFRQMLELVAFKKELIITIYMRQPDAAIIWEEQALQLHYELMDMGFAHHLYFTFSEGDCQQIARPTLSCVWDSSDLPNWVIGGDTALWHNRWKFVARGSRLGYNVMSVDSDTMFFRDPYVHLKQPPLRDLQMMCNPEGGSPYNCNGGFVYVQNARPDGPVSWVFMEVVRSTLRRADDHFQYTSRWVSARHNCLTFDQAIIQDALQSAAVGRMVPENMLGHCKPGASFKTRNGNEIGLGEVMRNLAQVVCSHMRIHTFQAGPNSTWLSEVGFTDVPVYDKRMLSGNLTVPNLNYGWPEELGGRLFPEGPPGEFSGPWVQMLKDDCPSCPWWPEERPVKEDNLPQLFQPDFVGHHRLTKQLVDMFIDPAIPQETYGQVPKWMSASLANVRRGTYLGPNASRQGYISVGHVHAWHMQVARSHKTMVRKVLGRYNWTLGMEVAQAHQRESPYLYGHKVTRVLALSPKVDLSRTRSWAELASIITGLVQVAWLSQRVVLMPDLPCQTAWLHHKDTLNNAELMKTVCLAPAFWHRPDFYPNGVAVPVDERGELIGGWARKLRGHQQQPQRRHADSRRRLIDDDTHKPRYTSDPWWEQQRYLAVMPQLWDQPCTGDMHGIISPEFFHWLKHTPEGQKAKAEPMEANTVLEADDEELTLQPALGSGPGTSSRDVPAGQVVPPESTQRWSFRDVQVKLSTTQVAEALDRVNDEPLVYLGHPVMVVRSQEEGGPQLHASTSAWFRRLGKEPEDLTPNGIFKVIEETITASRCKGFFEEPETHEGKVVDLNWGRPGKVVDGKIKVG